VSFSFSLVRDSNVDSLCESQRPCQRVREKENDRITRKRGEKGEREKEQKRARARVRVRVRSRAKERERARELA